MAEPVPLELTVALFDAYQTMAEAGIVVRDAITSEDDRYPVYLPTLGDIAVTAARREAAEKLTALFVDRDNDSGPLPGLVCASPDTIEKVHDFNAAKLAFKDAIMAIRYWPADPADKQTRPVRWGNTGNAVKDALNAVLEQNGYRNDQLKQAMRSASISSLDLKRCYAQIRIMPPNLDGVSWTWATNHSSVQKLTWAQAMAAAEALPDPQREVAVDLLSECSQSETFAKVKRLPAQLRANYFYTDNGVPVRKGTPLSGVMALQQDYLPHRLLWRDPPDPGSPSPKLPRRSSIEREPYIKALGLHRYVH